MIWAVPLLDVTPVRMRSGGPALMALSLRSTAFLLDFLRLAGRDGCVEDKRYRYTTPSMATLTRSILVTFAYVRHLVAGRLGWYADRQFGRRSACPSLGLSERVNRPRTPALEVISFFVLAVMACAEVILWLWNGLRKDFPILAWSCRACGMIDLRGPLFLLVLTMISGARESYVGRRNHPAAIPGWRGWGLSSLSFCITADP